MTSRARRMRSAMAGEEIDHPQRRLESPYDLVRLLVEMNCSPRSAAGWSDRIGGVEVDLVDQHVARRPCDAIASDSFERGPIGQRAGRVVR